jgi:hypothetical protein
MADAGCWRLGRIANSDVNARYHNSRRAPLLSRASIKWGARALRGVTGAGSGDAEGMLGEGNRVTNVAAEL